MDKNLLSQLRDIDGLDAINVWPLAPGWWALLPALAALTAVAGIYLLRWARGAGWRREKAALLASLRAETDAKKKAAALSALLRQAAIIRHGREACAGLEGTDWLDWLNRHDPAKFDWKARGRLLLDAPYAPAGMAAGADMDALVAAAEKWM